MHYIQTREFPEWHNDDYLQREMQFLSFTLTTPETLSANGFAYIFSFLSLLWNISRKQSVPVPSPRVIEYYLAISL